MKKIKTSFDRNLFINYFLRIILSSAICIILLSLISSFAIYKLDADIMFLQYISIVEVLITSSLTGYISVKPFKNNGFVLGVISSLPLIIYSLVNLLVNHSNAVIFIVKVALAIIAGGFFGMYSVKNNKKIRIK